MCMTRIVQPLLAVLCSACRYIKPLQIIDLTVETGRNIPNDNINLITETGSDLTSDVIDLITEAFDDVMRSTRSPTTSIT